MEVTEYIARIYTPRAVGGEDDRSKILCRTISLLRSFIFSSHLLTVSITSNQGPLHVHAVLLFIIVFPGHIHQARGMMRMRIYS